MLLRNLVQYVVDHAHNYEQFLVLFVAFAILEGEFASSSSGLILGGSIVVSTSGDVNLFHKAD